MRTYLATLHVGVHGFAQARTVECGRVLVRSRSDAKRILRGPISGPLGQRPINRDGLMARPNEAHAMPLTAPWLPDSCTRRRVACA